MIQNDEQLNHTRAAITDLEAAVASLKRDVLPVNPARFALMAEPAVDQSQELRSQVDDYVGISAAVAETATLWMKLEGYEIQPGDAPTSVVTKEMVTEEGVLREIDLDQRTFIVRKPGQIPETRCAIDSDADDLLEIAKEGLDHRVRVVGNRQTHPTKRQSLPLQVHEIEILGEPSEEDIHG